MTFAKFYEKLTFLTPDMHTCAYQVVRNVSFSQKFANVINEWSPCEVTKWLSYMLRYGAKKRNLKQLLLMISLIVMRYSCFHMTSVISTYHGYFEYHKLYWERVIITCLAYANINILWTKLLTLSNSFWNVFNSFKIICLKTSNDIITRDYF